jgi:hypothetical protein
MADVFGLDLGMDVPSFVSSTSFGGTITILLAAVIFIIAFGALLYFYIQGKAFKYKFIVFENVAGQGYVVSGKDKGRLIKIGTSGEEIFYLKKSKTYKTAYGKKMAKNTYWFAIGQDGYWYNVLLGDLDAKKGMLDIEPVDRDMRYAYVSLAKNIKERYNKESFMGKYGVQVFGILTIIIFFVGMWFLIDQLGSITNQLAATLDANQKTAEAVSNMLSHLDTINSGGSGISPA